MLNNGNGHGTQRFRKTGAVRKKTAPYLNIKFQIYTFFRQIKGKFLIGLFALTVAGAATWFFGPWAGSSLLNQSVAWQACLFTTEDGAFFPDLVQIPAGKYALPTHREELTNFITSGTSEIQVDKPFLLQRFEVTRNQFKQYTQFVARMPDGDDKTNRQLHIGQQWNRSEGILPYATGISWEGAWDYADWLSQQTGCSYTLPEEKEWLAAIGFFNTVNTPSSDYDPDSSPLNHLLRGVREWSQTSCQISGNSGYLLLGEDNWTAGNEIGHKVCMPAILSVAGFRLVLAQKMPVDTTTNNR
ncbi:MAG: formylglycine-generating enzyme family protein [Magnetococcus sp. DMHC-6]